MKGIVLTGVSGTRLYPIAQIVSQQLLSVYDKPMTCYPLYVLMLAGLQDILIISTHQDLPNFKNHLDDESKWGLALSFLAQPHPERFSQAFIIGQMFIGNDNTCLILRDNILYDNRILDNVADLKPSFQTRPTVSCGAKFPIIV